MGNPTPHPALVALSKATQNAERAYRNKRSAVLDARAEGVTWREICETAGITRGTGITWAREAEGGR